MRQLQKRKLIFVLLLLAVWASGCGKKQEPLREGERSYQMLLSESFCDPHGDQRIPDDDRGFRYSGSGASGCSDECSG